MYAVARKDKLPDEQAPELGGGTYKSIIATVYGDEFAEEWDGWQRDYTVFEAATQVLAKGVHDDPSMARVLYARDVLKVRQQDAPKELIKKLEEEYNALQETHKIDLERQQKLAEMLAGAGERINLMGSNSLEEFAEIMKDLQIPEEDAERYMTALDLAQKAAGVFAKWQRKHEGLMPALQVDNFIARDIARQLLGDDNKIDDLAAQLFSAAVLARRREENAGMADSGWGKTALGLNAFNDALIGGLLKFGVNAIDRTFTSAAENEEVKAVQEAIAAGNDTLTAAQEDDDFWTQVVKQTSSSAGMAAGFVGTGAGGALKAGATGLLRGGSILARAAAGAKGAAGALNKMGVLTEAAYTAAETDKQRMLNEFYGVENPLANAFIDTAVSRGVERIAFGGIGKASLGISNKAAGKLLTSRWAQKSLAKGTASGGLQKATNLAMRGMAYAESKALLRGAVEVGEGMTEEIALESAAEELLQGGVRGALRTLGFKGLQGYEYGEGERATTNPFLGSALSVWDSVTDPVMVTSTAIFCAGMAGLAGRNMRRQAEAFSRDLDTLRNTGITAENAARIAREQDGAKRLSMLEDAFTSDIYLDPEGAKKRLAERGEELANAREIALYADSGVRDYVLKKAGVIDIEESPDGKKYLMTIRKNSPSTPANSPVEGEAEATEKTAATAENKIAYTEEQLNAWLEMQAKSEVVAAMRRMQAAVSGERLAQAKPTADSVKGEIVSVQSIASPALARMEVNGGVIDAQVLDALAEDAAKTIDGLTAAGASLEEAAARPSQIPGVTLGTVMELGAGFRRRVETARAVGEIADVAAASAPVMRLDAAGTPGQSVLLYNSGHVTERAMLEDLIERDLVNYMEKSGMPLADMESYLRDAESIIDDQTPETIRLFPASVEPGKATRQDVLEAFSKLAQADFLANYEDYDLPDWAKVSLEYVAKRLEDTQKMTTLSDAWKAFAASDAGKKWQTETGKSLYDILHGSGIALASQYKAARDWQSAFDAVQKSLDNFVDNIPPDADTAAIAEETEPKTQVDKDFDEADKADAETAAAVQEAAQNEQLRESLTPDDAARLDIVTTAPQLADSPVMEDEEGHYICGEEGSEWRSVPADELTPAKGLPKLHRDTAPADREESHAPIVLRRENGDMQVIYGTIPPDAQNVTVQIFDEDETHSVEWARLAEIGQRLHDGTATPDETEYFFTAEPMNEGQAEEAGLRMKTDGGELALAYVQGKAQAEANADPEQTNKAIAAGAAPRFGRLSPQELYLSEDVPQWKEGANEQGESQPLTAAKWDERGVAPLSVWVREDGKKEVVSGRHRRALALRLGVPDVPCEFYYEADGFSATDAKLLDAELNIRDGNGSAKDFARYVRTAGIDADEARARGWLNGRAQSNGVKIAVYGGENLYSSFINGKLGEQVAAKIAAAAPGNDDLQRVGIKEIERKKSAEFAVACMQACAEKAAEETDGGFFSMDLFGSDDSFLEEARRMAEYATKMQRSVSQFLKSAEGAANNPEKFAKVTKGKLKNEKKIQETLARLRYARELWANYAVHPELAAEARAWSGKSTVSVDVDNLPDIPKGGDSVSFAVAEADAMGDFGALLEEKAVQQLLNDAKREAARWERVFGGKDTPVAITAVGMGRISAYVAAIYRRLPDKYRPRLGASLRLMEKLAYQLETGRLNNKIIDQTLLDPEFESVMREYAQKDMSQLAYDILTDAVAHMEKYLRDKELERIRNLADRLSPKDKKNGKPARGKMNAAAYRKFAEYIRLCSLTDAQAEAEMKMAETALAQARDNFDDEAAAEAENRMKAVSLFGDLAHQSLETVRRARAEMETFVKYERETWAAKLQDRREKIKHLAATAARWQKMTGVMRDSTERDLAAEKREQETVGNRFAGVFRSLRSLSQTFHRFAAEPGLKKIMTDSLDDLSRANVELSNREIAINKRIENFLSENLGLKKERQRAKWMAELNRVQDTKLQRPYVKKSYTLTYSWEDAVKLADMTAPERAKWNAEKKREYAEKGWEWANLISEDDVPALKAEVRKRYKELAGGQTFPGMVEAELKRKMPPEKIVISVEKKDKSNTGGHLNIVYSKNQLLNLWLMCQRERYKEQANEQGWTPEVLNGIKEWLGKDVIAFGEYLRQELDNSGLKEVFEEREGVPFASEPNYWPGGFDLSDKVSEKDALDQAAASLGANTYTMLIKPVKHKRQFDLTMGATNVFLANMAMHNNYICVGSLTQRWKMLLSYKPFSQGLRLQMGTTAFSQLKMGLNMLDGAGVQEAASHKDFCRLLGISQSARALSVLSASPFTMVKQASGIFNGKAYAGLSLPSFIGSMFSPGKASLADIAALPAFKARYASNKYFLSMLSMEQDYKVSSLDRLANWGMDWIEWCDIKSNLLAMRALYNHKYSELERNNEGAADKLTETQMQEICEQHVTNALELSAQPLRQSQKSLFAALNPSNLFNRIAGYMGSDVLNKLGFAVTQFGKSGGGVKGFWSAYKYIAGFAIAEQAILIAISLIKNAGLADDDDLLKFAKDNAITALTGMTILTNVPLLGAGFEELTKRITGGKAYARTGAMESATLDVSGTYNAGKKLFDLASDDKEHSAAETTLVSFNFLRYFTLATSLGGSKMNQGAVSALATLQSVNAIGNFLRPSLQFGESAAKKAAPDYAKKVKLRRRRKEQRELQKARKKEQEKKKAKK